MEPTLAQGAAVIWQVTMGVSLAACAGLRAFLPLLAVGVAGRMDWIPLTSYFDWLVTSPFPAKEIRRRCSPVHQYPPLC